MKVSVEKPGSPGDILEHFGRKGMKWGVRNTSNSSRSGIQKKPMSKKKKVAIGVGVVGIVSGAAFVGYRLKQNGSLPFSKVNRAPAIEGKTFIKTAFTDSHWNTRVLNSKASASRLSEVSKSIAERRRSGAPGFIG